MCTQDAERAQGYIAMCLIHSDGTRTSTVHTRLLARSLRSSTVSFRVMFQWSVLPLWHRYTIQIAIHSNPDELHPLSDVWAVKGQ